MYSFLEARGGGMDWGHMPRTELGGCVNKQKTHKILEEKKGKNTFIIYAPLIHSVKDFFESLKWEEKDSRLNILLKDLIISRAL